MIAVFCAVGGVEPQSETVWNQADRYRVPRIAFINKMDRVGADLPNVIDQMNKYLDANAFPFQIQIGEEENFTGIIDVIERKAYKFEEFERIEIPIPEEYLEKVEMARAKIVEKVAEFNEEIMQLYFDEKEVPVALLKHAVREATLKILITPVFCGAAYKNKGIQLLLDAVADYLPSPVDKGAVTGTDLDDPEKLHICHPSPKESFSALAFKLIHDPFVGQQTFTRIFSGTLKSGMQVFNATKKKHERIGRIMKIHAKEREEVSEAGPGDIVALIGLKLTKTGDTLCSEEHRLLLENIHVPPSVIELKINPLKRQDQAKLGEALHKLATEDPSFNVRYDEETEETVIAGMGELHLEIIVDRLKHEFKVDAIVGEPSVAFRETLTAEVESNYRHVKQTGGKGQFAHTVMRLEPNPGKGFEFVEHIKGGAIPAEFITSVRKGLEKSLDKGILAGYPVVDVRVTLLDGSFHAVDSSDMAFQTCAAIGFKHGFLKASPILLEPIMKVEVNTPDEYIGDIVGNLNRRRGRIEGMRRHRKGSQKINVYVPLMEMFGYSTQLRNISSGRANYAMEFYQYMPLPKNLQEEVLKKVATEKNK